MLVRFITVCALPAEAGGLAWYWLLIALSIASMFYGNLSAIGLDPSVQVTLSLAGSTSTLIGTLTQDAGAGNGTANFTDLQIDNAGTQTVIASANGLTAGTTTSAGEVVSLVVRTVLAPIAIIVQVLLYFDARIRKEGLDLQLLARSISAPQA